MTATKLRIGTHYEYPFGGTATRPEWLPQGRADWDRDLAKIRETGFDSVRIRLGFDSDLDEIAELLDACHTAGVEVLLGFMVLYPSYWFFEQYPDAKSVDRTGHAYPADAKDISFPRGCIDHPELRRRRNDLVAACAERFGGHPAIIAWDIENQPAVGPETICCYCANSVAAYQADLAARFGDIAGFNTAFGTSSAEFADVAPPTEIDTTPDSFWRDWREYQARNLSGYLLEGRQIIRDRLPGARVSWNVTEPLEINYLGQDWWAQATLEYGSQSNYSGSDLFSASWCGALIDLQRSIMRDRETWVAEFQGGPYVFGDRDTAMWRGTQIEAEINKVISHGVTGLYVYRWEPCVVGQELWINATVDVDEYDTERRIATQRVIGSLREDETFILGARRVRPRVGVYVPRSMALVSSGLGEYDPRKLWGPRIWKTTVGLYGLLMDLGYDVGFVTDKVPSRDDLDLVAVPDLAVLSPTERDALEAYAAAGGRVVGELPLSDSQGCESVAAWLGFSVVELDAQTTYFHDSGWTMSAADGSFGGFAFNDRLIVDAGDHPAVARFRDNQTPALLETGPGGRILVATYLLGLSYLRFFHRRARTLLGGWIPRDLEPDVVITGLPDEYRPLVEARVLEQEHEALLFVINRSDYPYELTVAARGHESVTLTMPAHGARRQRIRRVAGWTS